MKNRFLLTLIVLPIWFFSQNPAEESLVKWMSFKDAQELSLKQPKPLLVDVYTSWCGWCKVMMKNTYSDPNLSAYINNWFYPVKFDAETHDTIQYQGQRYINKGAKGQKSTHDLAIKLLGEKQVYPTTLFLANNFQYTLLSQGNLEVKKMEPLLVFIVEGAFRTIVYEDFEKNFMRTFYDTVFAKKQAGWKSMEEALVLEKKKPRKLMVSLGAPFCNTCKMMTKTTFTDPILIDYLSKNFYLVNFDVTSKIPVEFKGTTYKISEQGGFPFHELALELTKKNFVMPAMVVLDEALNILDVVSFYQSPEWTMKIAHFFGDNEYKKMKWDEYLKKEQQLQKP